MVLPDVVADLFRIAVRLLVFGHDMHPVTLAPEYDVGHRAYVEVHADA